MPLRDVLAQQIGAATGRPFVLARIEECAGGCINRAARVDGRDGRRFFVKFNDAARRFMFEAEADGLRALAATGAVRVPAPVCVGDAGDQAFLVLEYLALGHNAGPPAELGRQLAALHRTIGRDYGWERDNTIGATAQRNDWCGDWATFYREQRLRFQLELAATNGGARLQRLGAQVLTRMAQLFTDYRPAASLLHGDLWCGNAATSADGAAVLFDPAVYFGDREADLAMTELFGGFPAGFYQRYRDAWPVDPGYAVRKTLYNLYHVLNHFNLFGGAYAGQAERMMQELLSELR
jgi:fructosamine-3-kinase